VFSGFTGGMAKRRVGVALVVVAAAVAAMTLGPASMAAAAPGGAKCPAGATYNKQTKLCEQPQQQVQQCPAGSTLSGDKCVTGVTFVCPSGTTLQSDGACTGPGTGQCPDGYTLSADGTTCSGPYTCPVLAVPNGLGNCIAPSLGFPGSCPEGTVLVGYGEVGAHCEGPATFSDDSCPDRTSYNSDAGNCEGNPAPSCQSPFTLNTSSGQCETTPTTATVCPTGSTLNSSTGLCESAPTGGGAGGGGGGRPPKS
jgi:hypothetical protein